MDIRTWIFLFCAWLRPGSTITRSISQDYGRRASRFWSALGRGLRDKWTLRMATSSTARPRLSQTNTQMARSTSHGGVAISSLGYRRRLLLQWFAHANYRQWYHFREKNSTRKINNQILWYKYCFIMLDVYIYWQQRTHIHIKTFIYLKKRKAKDHVKIQGTLTRWGLLNG